MHKLGCIADDFTGATDLASVLSSVGRDVIVAFDPYSIDTAAAADADTLVIALKSRNLPPDRAAADTLSAAKALKAWGAEQVYLKYCSTFDSTSTGNIGPAIDVLLDELGLLTSVVAPAYPVNGRTVYQGHLFVGQELLSESPMRHHPLTPMRDSNLARLLEPQSRLPISHLYLSDVRAGVERIRTKLAPTVPRAVIADAIAESDLRVLAQAAGPHVLLTGGAGLALGLGPERASVSPTTEMLPSHVTQGGRLIVSGSASAMTRRQAAYAKNHMPTLKVDLKRLVAGEDLADEIGAWVGEQWAKVATQPVLVYATDSLDDLGVFADAEHGVLAERIERTLADVAYASLGHGLSALLVAGGETSGSVINALGVEAFRIGPTIAPGVVWATAETGRTKGSDAAEIAVALKSGNFGEDSLFTDAWEKLA